MMEEAKVLGIYRNSISFVSGTGIQRLMIHNFSD